MGSATAKVLSTYELLEAVLLNCQVRQLFVLQSVSPTWRSLVQRSEALRKKMFLLADGDALRPARFTRLHMPEYDDPLRLSASFNVHDEDNQGKLHATWFDWDRQGTGSGAANMRLRLWKKTLDSDHLALSITADSPAPGSSWKDVLLTQPPIKAALVWGNPAPWGSGKELCTIYSPTGVTLGDVFAVHAKLVQAAKVLDDTVSLTWRVCFYHSLGP